MNTHRLPIRQMLAVLIFMFASFGATAQPLRAIGDNEYGGTPGMHLFLPSPFIRSIHEDRLFMARMRYYRDTYHKAVEQRQYEQALAISDSLIYITEHHHMRGIRYSTCYQKRAQMLKALHRDAEACLAYERTITTQDSIRRYEQENAIREMQASYELDRLALDQALLQARHHKVTLIALALLLLASTGGVGFIYASNRHTKRLQATLLQEMHHARESEAKKAAFINSMCHEVRTPLNCIAGFSELLCADEITPEAHGQYCEIIGDNRRQLRYLFDDLLEVANLESMHGQLTRNYLELCGLCQLQLRIMKIRYPKPGLVYTDEIPADELGVFTSEKYVGMLIAALLNNAYKFTVEGHVRLSCGRVGEDRVFIAVEDTGCGIPHAQIEHVFERFTKLDTFSPGNGLGLYLCRLIVRHLGGEIHIDPAYSGGTRVVATLPRK